MFQSLQCYYNVISHAEIKKAFPQNFERNCWVDFIINNVSNEVTNKQKYATDYMAMENKL